jgi:purine nucleoside phosphorylase
MKIGLFVGSAPMDLATPEKTVVDVDVKWGAPSEAPVSYRLGDVECFVIRRHGQHGDINPHSINYRANIWQMVALGVESVIATHTVGSIDPDLAVGTLVVPDQLIDYTWGRACTFDDRRRHVEFSQPYDAELRTALIEVEPTIVASGVYGCTQGPRLETAAEISRMARDGCTLVGMTGMPEAGLAREVGLPFASVCLIVNPAAGVGQAAIDLEDLHRVSQQGALDFVDLIQRFCLD